MAQIMSEVRQRPVRFEQILGEAFRATLRQYGMIEPWARGLVDTRSTPSPAPTIRHLHESPPVSASGAKKCSSQPAVLA